MFSYTTDGRGDLVITADDEGRDDLRAMHERWEGGERSVGAKRDGNPGARESEPRRLPDHSSGWRNG